MSAFNQHYNSDNVYDRAVILGLLGLLDGKIVIYHQISDTERKEVIVPFNFNNAGDSRFLQDYFLPTNECLPGMAQGNYDSFPRGIIKLDSSNIDSTGLTNKWVRAVYTKETPEGNLETYSAYMNPVPMNFTFSVSLGCDSMIDCLKIKQEIIKILYKARIFHITFDGFRIGCRAKFPEDYNVDKTFEFDYSSEENVYLNFSIEVESYFPILDLTTERHNSNRIENFDLNINNQKFDTTSNVSGIIDTST